MPNLKSAKKAVRQSTARYESNKRVRAKLHRWTKDTELAISGKKKEDAVKSMAMLTKVADKAAKKNIIHKNKAARIKSRIQKKINAI